LKSHKFAKYLAGCPDDPVLEVDTTFRGDYIEVMIFVGNQDVFQRLQEKETDIEQELRSMGLPVLIYVRTWTGLDQGT
jgi:hypothetical protein